MAQSNEWICNLAKAVSARNGQQVVELLNPTVQLVDKATVDQEARMQEFLPAKQFLKQAGVATDPAQWQAFAYWATYFLKHSHCLDPASGSSTIEVFQAFSESYKAFERVCGLNFMDGKWVAIIVDHMTDLLVAYAEEADLDSQQSIVQATTVVNQ